MLLTYAQYYVYQDFYGKINYDDQFCFIITQIEIPADMEAYLIFVNFGTPPHYLGLIKVHKKT